MSYNYEPEPSENEPVTMFLKLGVSTEQPELVIVPLYTAEPPVELFAATLITQELLATQSLRAPLLDACQALLLPTDNSTDAAAGALEYSTLFSMNLKFVLEFMT